MLKKILTVLLCVSLLISIIPCSFADTDTRNDAPEVDGLLLIVQSEQAKASSDFFFYLSPNPEEQKLTVTQLPADQSISLSSYKNHILSNSLTLGQAFLLGQAWEGEAMAIDFSTVAVQSCFDFSPAHTLLISQKEDSPNVLAEVLSQLHIAAVSADPLAALGRILVGIAQLDDAAQNQLIAFIADNTGADADADTICTYLTELISGCDEYTISVSPAA